MSEPRAVAETLRQRTYRIIFGHDTAAGKAFDVALILFIVASVIVVMLESVRTIRMQYGELLRAAEWGFTILFTIEYVLRLWAPRVPCATLGAFSASSTSSRSFQRT